MWRRMGGGEDARHRRRSEQNKAARGAPAGEREETPRAVPRKMASKTFDGFPGSLQLTPEKPTEGSKGRPPGSKEGWKKLLSGLSCWGLAVQSARRPCVANACPRQSLCTQSLSGVFSGAGYAPLEWGPPPQTRLSARGGGGDDDGDDGGGVRVDCDDDGGNGDGNDDTRRGGGGDGVRVRGGTCAPPSFLGLRA